MSSKGFYYTVFGVAFWGASTLASPAFAQSIASTGNPVSSAVRNVGQELSDYGINLNASYLGEFADNPTGGARQGADYAGQVAFGADFDMKKLVGISGGSVHLLFVQRHGNSLAAQTIDNGVAVQQIYGGGQTFQLARFTYEQRLFDDKIDIEVGRTDLNGKFDQSELYCEFQSNGYCANPRGMAKDVSTSFFPAAVWGGDAIFNPTRHIYMMVGAYQSDPSLNPYANHGFDWSTQNSTGFVLPIEAGVKWRTPGAMFDNRYDVGVIFDRTKYSATTPFKVPFYDPSELFGRSGVYVQGQQMLWQAAPDSFRGIYGFAQTMFGTSGDKQISNFEMQTGIVWEGPFATRPNDDLGIAFQELLYNNNYIDALQETRIKEGGTERPYSTMDMAEINYAVQVNPWLNIMPNFQYVVHPDGLAFSTYPTKNLPNAFVTGLQFTINISRLLGL